MILIKYIYIIYVLIVWGLVFTFIKPQRIKELLPVSLLSALVLFASEKYLMTLGLYSFPNAFLPIFGVPFLHLLWGAGGGIIVMNFIPQSFAKKMFAILIFTVINGAFEQIPEMYGQAARLGAYSEFHDFIQDLLSLIIFVTISEGLLGKRIQRYRTNS